VEKAPSESYADVGGLEQQIQEIKEAVELPLTHPELYEDIGIKPPKVGFPWLCRSPIQSCYQDAGMQPPQEKFQGSAGYTSSRPQGMPITEHGCSGGSSGACQLRRAVLKNVLRAAQAALPSGGLSLRRGLPLTPPQGVILYGEPGTGKTLLAKAVANQTSASFLRVVGSELIQKYLGDGPKLVRELFRVADELSPSIVFIGGFSLCLPVAS
jgi:ATPase family associated with various cellular activities (AAA)